MSSTPVALWPPLALCSVALSLGPLVGCWDVHANSGTNAHDSLWGDSASTVTDFAYDSVSFDAGDVSSADPWSSSAGIFHVVGPKSGTPTVSISPPEVRRRGKPGTPMLAFFLLTVLLVGIYAAVPPKNKGREPGEAKRLDLQSLAAAATCLAGTVNDDSVLELSQALESRVAAIQSVLSGRIQSSADSKGSTDARLYWGLHSQEGGLEEDLNALRETTQQLLELTWLRLQKREQEAALFMHATALHASSAAALSQRFATDATRTEAAIVARLSEGAKQDLSTLRNILQDVERIKAAAPSDIAEAARVLETLAKHAKTVNAVSQRVERSFDQANSWKEVSRPVALARFLLEGTEIVHSIDGYLMEARKTPILGIQKEPDALRSLYESQQAAELVMENLRHEQYPPSAWRLLDRLRQLGRAADGAYDKLQKVLREEQTASASFSLGLSQGLEGARHRAQHEANTATMHALAVDHLVSRVATLEELTGGAGERHWQIMECASEALHLSKVVKELSAEAQLAAHEAAAAESLAAVEAKVEMAKKMRADAFEKALEVVLAVASYNAWSQLDAAVHNAVASIDKGVESLSIRNGQGPAHRRALEHLREGNAILTRKRYRDTKQLRLGGQQALAFLGTARRVELFNIFHAGRYRALPDGASP